MQIMERKRKDNSDILANRLGEYRIQKKHSRRAFLAGVAASSVIATVAATGLNRLFDPEPKINVDLDVDLAIDPPETSNEDQLFVFTTFVNEFIDKSADESFWSSFEEFSKIASKDDLAKKFKTTLTKSGLVNEYICRLFWPQDAPVDFDVPDVTLYMRYNNGQFDNAFLRARLDSMGKINTKRDDVIKNSYGFISKKHRLTKAQMVGAFTKFVKNPKFKITEWEEPADPGMAVGDVILKEFEDVIKNEKMRVEGTMNKSGFMQLFIEKIYPEKKTPLITV